MVLMLNLHVKREFGEDARQKENQPRVSNSPTKTPSNIHNFFRDHQSP